MKIEGFEESMLTPIVDYLNGDVKLDRSFILKMTGFIDNGWELLQTNLLAN